MGEIAATGLGSWDTDADLPDAALRERVLAHPRFTEAVHTLIDNMIAAGAADKSLDAIFKDAGRYGVAFVAIYLHLTGGLTLPRLKGMAAALSSPGRARAVLLYMRYLGYITRGAHLPGDPELFVPTQRCLTAWSSHLRAALQAAAVIEPQAQPVVDRFGEPEVFAAFARRHTQILIAVMAEAQNHTSPFVRIFLHRHAGSQILWTLIKADEGQTVPPTRTRPLVIAEIARRFSVSRTHVRRVLGAAAKNELVVLHPDDTVGFTQAFQAFLGDFYADQMVWLLVAASHVQLAVSSLIAAA